MADQAQNIFNTSRARSRLHPEDEANLSLSEDSDFENDSKIHLIDEQPNITDPPNMSTIYKSSSHLAHASTYQTGVKGVLADAHSYESAKRRELRSSPRSHERGFSIPEVADEDELMNAWRKNRLAELKSGAGTTRRHSPSKRSYGRVEPVDAAGYLDAIERVAKDTIVVVLIYDPRSPESTFVEDCLVTLAKRYPTTRFVKLPYTEAEMDPDVVPAVLAYKGGELRQSIMRIVDEIPTGRNLSTESLEWVLTRARILVRE